MATEEAKKVIDLEVQFYDEFKKKMLGLGRSNQFYEEFSNAVRSGKQEVYQKRIKEGQELDDSWVDKLESYIPYLDRIVRNPKYYMLAQEDIVRIEQARKINARSVIHLSTHTENVQDIQDDGVIVPKKVLVTHYEDNLAIYENRFIMTLIAKLAAFVELRYEVVKGHQISYTADNLHVNNEFTWRNYSIDFEIKLNVKEHDVGKQSRANKKLLDRVEELRKYAKVFINSPFYKEIRAVANPVGVPLLKTNILLHNVDYAACVELWDFLDSYRDLGFNVSVDEKLLDFDDKFIEDISNLVVYNYGTIVNNQSRKKDEYNLKKFTHKELRKPKVVDHLENEYLNPGAYAMDYPSISQYYYELTLNKEKQDINKMVNDGKTFNQALVTTYKRMQNIVDSVYHDVLKGLTPDYQKDDEYAIKRKEKYKVLKKKLNVLTRIADLKKADAIQALQEAQRVEALLERFATQEKEAEKQIKDYGKELRKKEKEADLPMSYAQILKELEIMDERIGQLQLEKDNKLAEQELETRELEEQLILLDEEVAKRKALLDKEYEERIITLRQQILDEINQRPDVVLASVPKEEPAKLQVTRKYSVETLYVLEKPEEDVKEVRPVYVNQGYTQEQVDRMIAEALAKERMEKPLVIFAKNAAPIIKIVHDQKVEEPKKTRKARVYPMGFGDLDEELRRKIEREIVQVNELPKETKC